MRCENHFCIYYEDDACLLDDIALDVLGNCESCIYVTLPESLLRRVRAQMRECFDAQDALPPRSR